MPKISIKVDPDLCIGAASCIAVAPGFFELNEESKAVVKDPAAPDVKPTYERVVEVTDGVKEKIILAAQSCPTLAISIFDETGKKLFPAS